MSLKVVAPEPLDVNLGAEEAMELDPAKWKKVHYRT